MKTIVEFRKLICSYVQENESESGLFMQSKFFWCVREVCVNGDIIPAFPKLQEELTEFLECTKDQPEIKREVDDGLDKLSRFCWLRAKGLRMRGQGEIGEAQQSEAQAEQVYAELPRGWTW